MKIKILHLFFLLTVISCSRDKLIYTGGLWNLTYSGYDISTFGHFKIYKVPYLEKDNYILRVDWIENINNKRNQLFASRLLPELESFIGKNTISIKSEDVLSTFCLINSKNDSLWLILLEPGNFKIQKQYKVL